MIRISVWKKCHCDYYYYYCNFTFIENRHLWLYIYRFEDMRKRQRYLCARDIGLAGRYWYSCRNIYGLFWTYDKLHIIVFIVMKMIIMLGGMLHPISLRSDKLVSRGCIQLFFFALFCSHTFMYYTIFFLSNRTFDIVSVRTVKRVLSFSLSVNVYCWNWTHTASRWEKHQKKAMGNIQNATAKQKLTKTDITLIYA